VGAIALVPLTLLWLSAWALGHRDWTRPSAAPVSVSLIQGNIPQDMKFRPEKLDATLRHYARAVLASESRLIVLPETALPLFRSSVPRDYLELLGDHARARNGDVVLGIPEDGGPERYYNSIVTLGGAPGGTYRKVHLVPFGEFVPPGFRWAVDMMSIPLGDFSKGAPDQPPLAAGGEKLAVNVCYEDAFGEERVAAARNSTLLVNLSNDAWFGASLAPWQHLQIGAMRSLEAGRWQLRANNTGITAILDDKGRVRARLAPFTPGTLHGQAQGRTGSTPYLNLGNLPAILIALALLLPARRLSHH
jgi:apolipoprotein N-acyltransferase